MENQFANIFINYSPKDQSQLDVLLANRVREYEKFLLNTFSARTGLKFKIEFDGQNDNKKIIDYNKRVKLYKNLAWLTSTSILDLDGITWSFDDLDPVTIRELSATFNKYNMKKLNPLISGGHLLPLPKYINLDLHNSQSAVFTRNLLEEDDNTKRLSNRKDILQEKRSAYYEEVPVHVLEFIVPNVMNVPSVEIASFRKDNNELFSIFQHGLIKQLNATDAVDTESKLADLLIHIDQELIELEQEIRKVDSKKALEKQGLVYSAGVLSMALIIPEEIFKSLVSVLGVSNLLYSLRNVKLNKIELEKLKSNPFYIPCYLKRLSSQVR